MIPSVRLSAVLLCALVVSACTSTGTLGMVSRSTAASEALRTGRPFKELGPTHGSSCRFFLLGLVPWGDGTVSDATQDALERTGADAVINATVETSLYGFVPIYQLFSYTCTSVSGTAVKFESEASAAR